MTRSPSWFAAELWHRGRPLRTLRCNRKSRLDGWPIGRRRTLLFAALLSITSLPGATSAQARDLVVYGEPTLEKALKAVGVLWQARTGTRVNVFVAPTDLSLAQIERGARCDLIFALPGAATDEAARGKTIHADSITRALRNSLVLVGNEPAAPPGTGITLADFGKLIGGKRLAIANPDRDVGGAQALDLLRKIGIIVGDNNNETVTVAESSAGVLSLLSTNKARLGIVYATDATSGFKLALPLPALERAPIDYIVARARDPEADTQLFMAFLKSPEAKAAFKSAGLIPLDD